MRADDDTHAERPLDLLDRLRHDLRSPLTTIRGRAYLLARAVRRAPSLTDEERTRMLAGVAAIEAAVAAMVVVIDGIDGDRTPADGGADTDRS
jgi:signal transduction histidine kinase